MEFEVLDLGLTRYADAHAKQLELLKARIAGEINDTLILTQHHKVFTLCWERLRAGGGGGDDGG